MKPAFEIGLCRITRVLMSACFEYLLPGERLGYKVFNSFHVLSLNTATLTSLSI
jgi:hypothetical protein